MALRKHPVLKTFHLRKLETVDNAHNNNNSIQFNSLFIVIIIIIIIIMFVVYQAVYSIAWVQRDCVC
jgi:t-SNARE complex subunit (syntaxin)